MFLTKKSFRKLVIVAIVYAVLGSFCIMFGLSLGTDGKELVELGAATYLLGGLFVWLGRYAEGKGKLINEGNKLLRKELKPAAFIKRYEALKNDPDLVTNQPSLEILAMVSMAYDLMGDRESTLATTDEMFATAPEQRKVYAKLTKASYLFSYGEVEEAEALLSDAQQGKLTVADKGFVENLTKSDRALAMGDYKMVERYCLELLERKFPKPDELAKVVIHYLLGEAYWNMGEGEKAREHYRYCAENGGELAIRQLAAEKLQ